MANLLIQETKKKKKQKRIYDGFYIFQMKQKNVNYKKNMKILKHALE